LKQIKKEEEKKKITLFKEKSFKKKRLKK